MPRRKQRNTIRFIPFLILLIITSLLIGRFSLQRYVHEYPPLPSSVDVIVVGSGLTGWTAALSAAEAGADVFYLSQQEPDTGGFPAFSPAFWATGVETDEDGELLYPAEVMATDLFLRGQEVGNMSLILNFSQESRESLLWLEQVTATSFFLPEPPERPGLFLPLEAEAEQFVFQDIMEKAMKQIMEYSHILQPIRLLVEDGRVRGMVVQDDSGQEKTIYAQAVVLADGGYGSNPDMLANLAQVRNVTSRPEGGHRGLGLQLGMNAGARTDYLSQVTLLPVFLPQGQRVEQVDFPGAVFSDATGRLVPLGETLRETIVAAGGQAFIITGEPVGNRQFIQMDTLLVLASHLEIDLVNAAMLTMDFSAPYYVASVGNIALTPGGLAIDEEMRILTGGGAVDGLYAAGEIAAGLHGMRAIPALVFSEAVTSGRMAGRAAAAWARR
jgi:fumarate reductase flavoprotein subunit